MVAGERIAATRTSQQRRRQPDGTVAARFAYTRVHAIGMELPRARGQEIGVLESVGSLAGDARKNGQESFVLGVTNTSRAISAMAAGVRYLEGPAIHPVVADPRCAIVHELEDLYGSSEQPNRARTGGS